MATSVFHSMCPWMIFLLFCSEEEKQIHMVVSDWLRTDTQVWFSCFPTAPMIFTRLGQVAVKMILKYWGQLNFCHFNSVWWKHYLLLFEIQLSNLVPIICLYVCVCVCVCVYTYMHVVDAMVWHPETSSCPSSHNLSLWGCWLLMVFISAAFVLG